MNFFKGFFHSTVTTLHTPAGRLVAEPAPRVGILRRWSGTPAAPGAALVLAALLASAGSGYSACVPAPVESYPRTVNHLLCDTSCETLTVVIPDPNRYYFHWWFSRNFGQFSTRLSQQTNATLTLPHTVHTR